jgi:hypothetical protein
LYLVGVGPGDGKCIGIVDTADLAASIVGAFKGERATQKPGLFQAEGRTLIEDGFECGFLDTEEIALAVAERMNEVNDGHR